MPQPRYVVNRVTYGDYDCPRKVLNFLTDLHAAFRMLNLRNDFLRKKFDGVLSWFLSFFVCIFAFLGTWNTGSSNNLFFFMIGMKYDLKRVEEVYYDVKIRGLADNGGIKGDQGIQGQP